jgi:hypothetical protein
MRTIVELPEDQLGALSKICADLKISRAEAVRRAVARLIKDTPLQPTDVGFGAWKHKRLNVRKHLDTIRGEWGDK